MLPMSMSDLSLHNHISSVFNRAVETEYIRFSEKDISVQAHEGYLVGEPYTYKVIRLDSLVDRPESNDGHKDPFSQPEPELAIDLNYSDSHFLVLNRFPVLFGHFMMVTKEFESQNNPLSLNEIGSIFQILTTLGDNPEQRKWFAFYNCGPESGASQPHKHIQFMSIPEKFKTIPERILELERIENIERMQPNISFAYCIERVMEGPVDAEALFMIYVSLLRRVLTLAKRCGIEKISYSFCCTTKYIFLVPRKSAKADSIFGVNACAFMGLMICKDDATEQYIKSKSPEEVLKKVTISPTVEIETCGYDY